MLFFTEKRPIVEKIFGDYYSEDNDITRRGWIKLNHSLMNPIYHIMCKKKKVITDEDCLMDIINQLKEDPSEFLESRRNAKNSQLIDFLYENLNDTFYYERKYLRLYNSLYDNTEVIK